MKRKITLDPKRKLFKYGPIDGRPIYVDYWWLGFRDFAKEFYGWPDAVVYHVNERVTVVIDHKALYDKGEKNFNQFILRDKAFSVCYKRWQCVLKELISFIEKLEKKNLQNLTKDELYKTYKNFEILYGNFWSIGSLPEVANWGGEQILARELHIKTHNERDFHYAFEKLSAPTRFSFYQKEENDLLSLKGIENKRIVEKRLKQHQKKYFWLSNNYHSTKVISVRKFAERLQRYSIREARERIEKINMQRGKTRREKKKVIRDLHLSKRIEKISQRLSFCIWWQDCRKASILHSNHVIDLFLREIAQRYTVPFGDLHYYTTGEISRLLQTEKKLSQRETARRRDHFVAVYRSGVAKAYYISGDGAKKLADPLVNQKMSSATGILKGIVVNSGKARGIVRILYSARESSKIKEGDILVASMTSPEYIGALRKAVAVVTDEGGMTCHAAIVARELGIPGIVGTKTATKILKDGDLVEVNADKGVVKIPKSNI